MKLLYDHQIFDIQQYDGIPRYFYELMHCYATAGEPDAPALPTLTSGKHRFRR